MAFNGLLVAIHCPLFLLRASVVLRNGYPIPVPFLIANISIIRKRLLGYSFHFAGSLFYTDGRLTIRSLRARGCECSIREW